MVRETNKMKDVDIRIALKEQEFRTHSLNPDTIIIDELAVCQGNAKIDIAVINGSIQGYEIKSDVDTLRRLPSQIDAYNKVFDYLTIVTRKGHIEGITKIVPEWWGILEAMESDGVVFFKPIRKATINNESESLSIIQLLWKNECIQIINEHLKITKGITGKTKKHLWTLICDNLTLNEIKDIVRTTLKNRTNWKVAE